MLTSEQIETTRRVIAVAKNRARVLGWDGTATNADGGQDLDSLLGTVIGNAALVFYGQADVATWEPGGPGYQDPADWATATR